MEWHIRQSMVRITRLLSSPGRLPREGGWGLEWLVGCSSFSRTSLGPNLPPASPRSSQKILLGAGHSSPLDHTGMLSTNY